MSKTREQLVKQMNRLHDKKIKTTPVDNGRLDSIITQHEGSDTKEGKLIYSLALELRINRLNQKIYGGY